MSTTEELSALVRKYRKLHALRVDYARTGRVAEKDVLRALAAEFPGALRELDRLPLEEIERRAEALERAAAGGESEPWMQWLAAYHALLRAALFVKAESAKGIPADEALAIRASAHARVEIDVAFVGKIASAARLSRVVLDEVARRFGVMRKDVEAALML